MHNEFENNGLNGTLMGEIFSENSFLYETVLLEITPVHSEMNFEFTFELDDVGKRIAKCLENTSIPGIKSSSVKLRTDAEIILEFETITQNRKAGNMYRDKIGEALRKCSKLFSDIIVERKGAFNSIKTPHGQRYGDIYFVDKTTGNKYLIEAKRGESRYHLSQKNKDAWIKTNVGAETYVVRGLKKEFLL